MPERIQDGATRGVLIEEANPYPEVRKYAEVARDWEYSEQAAFMYRWAGIIRSELIDPVARIDRNQMPDPVLSFENLRNHKILAAYNLVRNPQGLNYEIILNTQHYKEQEGQMEWVFGRWALLETLTHELVHEWQQTVGEDPVQVGRVYHNREFVVKCNSIGLYPKLGEGYHTKPSDGFFATLMDRYGIQKPEGTEELPEIDIMDWFRKLMEDKGKERKGKSTLQKFVCPNCDKNIRWGRKADPELMCIPCGAVLINASKGEVFRNN